MKKFLAVLLAVALLGVAGAAFARDEAGHPEGGHKATSGASNVVPLNILESMDAVFGTTVELVSADGMSDATLDRSAVPANVAAVPLAKLTGLVPGTTYALTIPSFGGMYGKKNPVLYSDGTYAAAVKVSVVDLAGVDKTGRFFTTAGTEIKDDVTIPTSGYVAFTPTKSTATLVAAASDGPASNKGSGGCNAGFASIAVLALGLAALRRKAR